MNDPFLAFEHNPDNEESEKILAAGFDWDDLERRLETDPDPKEVIAQARAEGNMEMLTKILTICAEGVVEVKQVRKRRDIIASRLLCIASVLRPGQAIKLRVKSLSEATGLSMPSVFRTLAFVKKRMR